MAEGIIIVGFYLHHIKDNIRLLAYFIDNNPGQAVNLLYIQILPGKGLG